jgi:hypothetical protein
MKARREGPPPVTGISTLDAILGENSIALERDVPPNRNHKHRVANLCLARSPRGADALEKIAIAAKFHDLGIWTDHTLDDLAPSVRLASVWVADSGKSAWTQEMAEMILWHHKITRYRAGGYWLVEPFRRADWVDVTRGLLTFGTPRTFIAELHAKWPDAGFHTRLVQLELGHLRKHPLNPPPVFRL